jgi:hypothetical protein
MSSPPFRLRTLGAVGSVAALVALAACSSSGGSSAGGAYASALASLHLRGARATLESLA